MGSGRARRQTCVCSSTSLWFYRWRHHLLASSRTKKGGRRGRRRKWIRRQAGRGSEAATLRGCCRDASQALRGGNLVCRNEQQLVEASARRTAALRRSGACTTRKKVARASLPLRARVPLEDAVGVPQRRQRESERSQSTAPHCRPPPPLPPLSHTSRPSLPLSHRLPLPRPLRYPSLSPSTS